MVDKVAALIDKNGKAALVDFRKADSEWFHGTTYLFAYDVHSNRSNIFVDTNIHA